VHDLTQFSLGDMTACGAALRAVSAGAGSMEEVATRIVHHLYGNLAGGPPGERACALVRFFKTHAYGALDRELQATADALMDVTTPSQEMKCLTLLATCGERPEWNERRRSVGHRAIPLPSKRAIARVPMIAQLIKQLGLEESELTNPQPALMMDAEQRTYNVFYVPEARGSPYIPAQTDFVVPVGIRSVLGFGGLLPPADLFVVILFSKVPIPRQTSELFKPLALSAKVAVLPFAAGPIFG
jgi:hypothetical protein